MQKNYSFIENSWVGQLKDETDDGMKNVVCVDCNYIGHNKCVEDPLFTNNMVDHYNCWTDDKIFEDSWFN